MSHALLSASGSSRWIACPPSARLEEKETKTTSEYAREGTLAHEIGELMIRYNANEIKKATFTRKLNKLKQHELFSNDMLEYCEQYANIVREKYLEANQHTADPQIIVEQRLDFSNYVPEGFGTGDALIIADGVIEVIDLKYGKGIEVSSHNNSQMKLYGLGAICEYEMLYDIHTINLTIVQPRLENISTTTIALEDLLEWGERIKEVSKLAWNGEGEFCAGSHCMFCAIKPKCKAYAEAQLEVAKYEFAEGPYLSDEAISDILSRATDFEKWLKAVKEYALNQAVNEGKDYPGYKLVEGRSNRKYTDQDKVLNILLAEGFEEDAVHKPKELLGITAMEKLLSKKVFNALLTGVVEKPAGSPTLVPESDKRSAWKSEDDAKKDFQS